MNNIIDRLKKEKVESLKNIEKQAKKVGLQWAETASYDKLVFAYSWSKMGIQYLEDNIEQARNSENADCFMSAWFEAVIDFYDEIKGKI